MKKKIKSILTKNKYLFLFFLYIRLTFINKYFTNDIKFIEDQTKKKLDRDVNLKAPMLYNDKIQWLKINWQDSLASKCADKYEVREFVEERIGSEYLNQVYGVYDSVEDINLNELPNSFVLKASHASGFNIICKDKNLMNWNEENNKMWAWLKINYFWKSREWVYKDIKPRIICENYLVQEDSKELRDYRFFCFNGKPKFISVDFSINDKKNTRRNLYDLDWNLMKEEISYPRETTLKVEKPEKFDEMVKLSEKLSKGFPHVRIDFYYINQKIIFGEMTFFHQSGIGKFKSEEFERKAGDWIALENLE